VGNVKVVLVLPPARIAKPSRETIHDFERRAGHGRGMRTCLFVVMWRSGVCSSRFVCVLGTRWSSFFDVTKEIVNEVTSN
jgi:hypothetical protein